MTDFSKTMAIAASGMSAQASRLRVTSENIANTDTPGYRRKIVPFEQAFNRELEVSTVRVGRVSLDQTDLDKVFQPSHPLADEEGYYLSSNVNTIVEIADAREAQRSYDANLKIFDQARKMTSSVLDLLRR